MSSKTEIPVAGSDFIPVTMRSDQDVTGSLRTFLRDLLSSGIVSYVFALRGTPSQRNYSCALISDPDLVDELEPFLPVMPVQGARSLSQLTLLEPLDRKTAVLLRPCELNAFVEDVRQKQGSMENMLLISCTCPGVFPTDTMRNADGDLQPHERRDLLRQSCRTCTNFIPGDAADITLLLESGNPTTGTALIINTEDGREAAAALQGFSESESIDISRELAGVMLRRQDERKNLSGSIPDTAHGLSDLVSAFSACIGCRACREACPVCSCTLCNYEKAGTVHSQDVVYRQLESKGALRVPSGTLQFHIGRMIHVSPYCTGCGQCSDVCPVDIPVADLFVRAAEMVQKKLDCHPGEDPDAPAVMTTYRQKELLDITD